MIKTTDTLIRLIQKNLLLIATLFITTNAFSQNNIGRVIHTTGDLVATNRGDTRTLQRGSTIEEGDIINSGPIAVAQLRMLDGALIVLRQNSKMQFEAYHYDDSNKSLSSSIFSLIQGGFKTISGLIGKHNKKNYKVKTSVASIGIRGTNYGITLCENNSCSNNVDGILKDGLYASVIDGEISSENQAGLFIFSNDEYFYVADATSKPQGLLKSPGIIFDPAITETSVDETKTDTEQAETLTKDSLNLAAATYTNVTINNEAIDRRTITPTFEAADDVSNNTVVSASTTGDAMMFSYFEDQAGTLNPVSQTLIDDGTNNNKFVLNAIAIESGNYIPVASNLSFGAGPTSRTLQIADATSSDVNSMTIANTNLGWGRWSDDLYETSDNGVTTNHAGSLHYIVADGGLTTPTQISAMTGTFNYLSVDGTKATDANGNIANNIANIDMAVDFGLQNINAFAISTNVGAIDYQAELSAAIPITTAVNNGITITGNASGACPVCGGVASLGFVGTQAEGAITSYNIGNAGTSTTISGTAVLQR